MSSLVNWLSENPNINLHPFFLYLLFLLRFIISPLLMLQGRLGLLNGLNLGLRTPSTLPHRDGVIDATIDHDAGVVASTEIADVYSTPEPAAAFHRRIQHLTDTHNQVRVLLSC